MKDTKKKFKCNCECNKIMNDIIYVYTVTKEMIISTLQSIYIGKYFIFIICIMYL